MMSVIVTTIGPTQFGRMCRTMIRMSLAPEAFAASTNSFSRSERKTPLTMRASPVQKRNARMSPTFDGWEIVIGPSCESFDRGRPRRREQDGEAGQREDEVGEAHEQVVHRAAVVAGDGADHGPDQGREHGDEDRDPERGPEAEDDAAQVVATEQVGADQWWSSSVGSAAMLFRSSSSYPYGAICLAKIATSASRMRTMRLATASRCRKKRMRAYAHWLRALSSTPLSCEREVGAGPVGSSGSAIAPAPARRRRAARAGHVHGLVVLGALSAVGMRSVIAHRGSR